jgi:hypothetical protein
MLQTVPELTFLRALSGDYRNAGATEFLRIRRCGYGVTLETSDERKTRMVGVVGAVGAGGHGVECFAQMGMPNVYRLLGHLESATSLRLASDGFGIALTVAHENGAVRMAIVFEGLERAAHEFRSDAAWRAGSALVAAEGLR